MDAFRQDLRLALGALRRARGDAMPIVAMIVIAVAAGASLFTVYKGALLDPWPYEGGDRIVVFRGTYPVAERTSYPLWSAADLADVRALDDVFDHVIAGRGRDVNLSGDAGAARVLGAELTPNAFSMLGVAPLHGRALGPPDAQAGAEPAVVIGHALWMRHYNGDLAAVGRRLLIEGTPHVIVGVMPPRFRWWDSEIWFPLAVDFSDARRDVRRFVIQARLRPGVDVEQASAALETWARRVEQAHAGQYPEFVGWQVSIGRLGDAVLGNVRNALRVLLVAVAMLVLVAAFNVASLLLARSAARRREFAVRSALGASNARLARGLLTENLALACLGGALGLAGAAAATNVLVGLIPYGYYPAEANVALDARVIAVAGGLALLVAVLSVVPAIAGLRGIRIGDALREGRGSDSRATVRLRSAFVVGQLALAAAVAAAALAAGLHFRDRLSTDPGFVADDAMTLRFALTAHAYPDGPALAAFSLALESTLSRLPGVTAAAVGTAPPLAGGPMSSLIVRGQPAPAPLESRHEVVTAGWFGALGVPRVTGRTFDSGDRAGSQPVAVVNAAFVRHMLGGADPIGLQVQAGPGAGDREWLTIVGVVGDVAVGGLDQPVRPLLYQPLAQSAAQPRQPAVLVRGEAPPEVLVDAVRQAVAVLDPAVPVFDVSRFSDVVVDSLGGQRLAAWLLGSLALTALVLAAMGVHGIVAWVIRRSRAELALRLALGASPRQIVMLVGRRHLVLAAAGLGTGALLGVGALRLVSTMLELPPPAAGPILATTSGLVAVIVLLASAGPAALGARTDPASALRD